MPSRINRQRLIEFYRWGVIALGSFIIASSIFQLTQTGIGWRFWVLTAFTALIASQISIKIPRFNGTITVSDTFVFLALLIWGAPAAVIVAVAENAASTSKVSRRVRTYLFNAGIAATTVSVTSTILQHGFGSPSELNESLSSSSFVLAMCAMSLTYYLVSMTQIAAMQALKLSLENWRTWLTQSYLWSCATFFVAAAAAGITVRLIGNLSLVSIIFVLPIIALVYFTYRSYLRNLDALQESESRFRSSFDYAAVGMALVSLDGKWLQINPALSDLLEKNESELLESYYQSAICDEDLPALETKIAHLIAGNYPAFQMEARFVRADGAEVWVLLGASTAADAQKAVRHLIFQVQDIGLRKKAEDKLRYDATHDALTGLPNRASYSARLADALARTKNQDERFLAVLFLDLDGFKLINDSLGHVAGDELLKGTAARLLECVRGHDTVARLGGDEFTILLEDLHDIALAVRVAERVKEKLGKPFQIAGQEIFIGTSIGIATTLIDYNAPGDILRDADAAMYQAKASGKGCHVVFDEEMHANATRLLRLANDLRRAIERRELVVHYQAIHSLEDNRIRGFEALMRWQHPTFGLLMPADFIPLAEENGLINQIDNWALSEACKQMREWQKTNSAWSDLIISVNISTKQFAQAGLVDHVKQVLLDTKISSKCLQLEITESAMVKNLKNTARILAELNLLGVGIALDDFGTGYSSLSYLHELPISTLKIDRSFIKRLADTEADGAEIVRAVITLARSLQMKVIAEGIETEAQFEQLAEMQCEFGQGYLFSRAIVAADATELLTKSHLAAVSNHFTARRKGLRLVSNG